MLNLTQLGDYYANVASWYMRGGFVDELGQVHRSGHKLPIKRLARSALLWCWCALLALCWRRDGDDGGCGGAQW